MFASSSTLTYSQGVLLLVLVVTGALIAGLITILGRKTLEAGSKDQGGSLIRSWIAITLVLGLVLFAGAVLLIDDMNLRSTIFGGLIASVGAAVAFYFSSKTADQARGDILNAAVAMSHGMIAPSAFSRANPPPAAVNSAYTYRFVANGHPAPTYRVASGDLPAGLTLDDDGTLHGTPTAAGTSTVTIAASNSAGAFVTSPISLAVQ